MFLPVTDAPGPGPKDGGLAALVDDSPQKRLLTQKATPPPSPLLSELLKKGNLISASPRLVSHFKTFRKYIHETGKSNPAHSHETFQKNVLIQ